MLVPATLFHELLHTHITACQSTQQCPPRVKLTTCQHAVRDEKVQDYPDFNHPNFMDPAYQATLPMVTAYGFSYCYKLGLENPALAVTNCDNVAYCALGILESEVLETRIQALTW